MTNKSPIAYIVDDDEILRSSFRLLLESVGITVTTFGSACEFLATHNALQLGCLVLDIHLPGMSGMDLQQHLNLSGSIIPIIFITGHGDVPMAVKAMKHGAFDFLQKPFRSNDLIDRVQRAFVQDVENHLALSQHAKMRARLESLSPRERQTLDLMTVGTPNKVMAADLGISQRTVEIHRARVMEKLAVSSLAQAVRIVMELKHAS